MQKDNLTMSSTYVEYIHASWCWQHYTRSVSFILCLHGCQHIFKSHHVSMLSLYIASPKRCLYCDVYANVFINADHTVWSGVLLCLMLYNHSHLVACTHVWGLPWILYVLFIYVALVILSNTEHSYLTVTHMHGVLLSVYGSCCAVFIEGWSLVHTVYCRIDGCVGASDVTWHHEDV